MLLAYFITMEELTYLKSIFDSYMKRVYNEDNLTYIPYQDTLNAGDLCTVPGIIVKFPHLTVTNSRNQAHQITDLYVWITLDLPLTTLRRIKILRSTLTMEEYESHYVFSHADGITVWDFHGLCFGSGEIKDYIEGLGNRPILSNKVSWSLLPQQLHRYFQWESLEGGPYHRIGDIASGTPIDSTDIDYACLTRDVSACKNCRRKCSNFVYSNLKKILHNIPVDYIHGKLTISKCNYTKLFFNIVMLLKDETKILQELQESEMPCRYKGETFYTYSTDKLLLRINQNPNNISSKLLFYFNEKPVFSLILHSQMKIIGSISNRMLSLMFYIIIKILNKL